MPDPLSPTPLSEDMRALIASGELPEYRDVLALCDEVDRLRALADPAPVGLTEDERQSVLAIIDRLTGAEP